jgi:hypothetical protein
MPLSKVENSQLNYTTNSLTTDDCRKFVFEYLVDETCRDLGVQIIVKLAHAYNMLDQTVAHVILLLDRVFMTMIREGKFSVLRDHIRLYSIACFVLVAKLIEGSGPALKDPRICSGYSAERICECEIEILMMVGWDIHVDSGQPFLIAAF